MMIDHAFGRARGAGGIAQRDRLPFILGPAPIKIRRTAGNELFKRFIAERGVARLRFGIIHRDHMRTHAGMIQGCF